MAIHPLAGHPAPESSLIDVTSLNSAFMERLPDPQKAGERISFGTSGHRGTSANGSFNEAHILAISQAIAEYRLGKGIDGLLYIGKDTHALSSAAEQCAVEVLTANGINVVIQDKDGFVPTPVISRAIVRHNSSRQSGRHGIADGIVITPSHNPPQDGGFKYNPPNGGPADTDVTALVEARANQLLEDSCGSGGVSAKIKRISSAEARRRGLITEIDYVNDYVEDLSLAIDFDCIRRSGLRLAADPMGGASVGYWGAIAERYNLDITVVSEVVDPKFGFMTLDHDGKIRMDCSSPYAMKRLLRLQDKFDLAFGNDPDADRHGIVTPSFGLLNPNFYLAVAIYYLFTKRNGWTAGAAVGKTLVSSAIIDRVARHIGRNVCEVPVGFKWFVPGLSDGSLGFGGEESAGASFLCFDGSTWTTDKDGLLLNLLAAEITASLGKDPALVFADLAGELGRPFYTRVDVPAAPDVRAAIKKIAPERITRTDIFGDPIVQCLTNAPGNGKAIGGIKVEGQNSWFAIRPSGTEDIYKVYAESFISEEHLSGVVDVAQAVVVDAVAKG